jgi:hypothetical protein
MTEVFLLYLGDAWLSTASLHVIAVCTSMEWALIVAQREFNLDEDELRFLATQKQTQGRAENLYIEQVQTDTRFAD